MVNRELFHNERGALLIPFLLLTTIVAFSGFGIWGMLRNCRKQVEVQLRLDECVGKKALELKALLKTLTASNTRMKWVRRSAAIGVVAPEVLEAIRAELEIELALQEGLRLQWRAESLASVAGRACSDLRALAVRYPLLEWTRLPPDFIGPQVFTWPEPDPKFDLVYKALSGFSGRFSGARVQGEKNVWVAKWQSWANFH